MSKLKLIIVDEELIKWVNIFPMMIKDKFVSKQKTLTADDLEKICEEYRAKFSVLANEYVRNIDKNGCLHRPKSREEDLSYQYGLAMSKLIKEQAHAILECLRGGKK